MRQNVVLIAVLIVALSTLVTAAGVVWLCVKVDTATDRFFLAVAARDEADVVRDVTVTDALLRIEEAATAARVAAERTAQRVEVATELGYQNAEAARRMEDADAHVAADLAESIARADSLPQDGNFGAAADAALRSPDDE